MKDVKGVLNLKRLVSVIILFAIISGCSFSEDYTDAIKQTDEYLENEQFDKAHDSIQRALEEKPEDDVALNIESGLLKYQKLLKYQEKREWEEVSNVINSFGTLDSVHPKLKKQVDQVKKNMSEQTKLEKKVTNNLEKINSLITKNLYEDADKLLVELEDNEDINFANKEIKQMRELYDKQYKQYKVDEKEAKRKEELDNLLLRYESDIIKAEKLEKENQSNNSIAMLAKIEESYDDVLNEVYQSIIKEFKDEEEELRNIQREWLTNYEDKMRAKQNINGDKKALKYSIKAKKERTQELLNKYF